MIPHKCIIHSLKKKKKGNFYQQVPYQMPLASIKLEYI